MSAKSPITWIFVTDEKKAKILINEGPKTGLKEMLVQDMEARLKRSEPVTRKNDKAGWWIFSSSSAKKKTLPKSSNNGELIDNIVSLLNRSARRDHFDTLLMVGPKSTLAYIKDNITPAVEQRIHGELSKDLSNVSDYELERYLGNIIRL